MDDLLKMNNLINEYIVNDKVHLECIKQWKYIPHTTSGHPLSKKHTRPLVDFISFY